MQTDHINNCKRCHGNGFVVCPSCGGEILFERRGTCLYCNGSGVDDCPECKNPEEFR